MSCVCVSVCVVKAPEYSDELQSHTAPSDWQSILVLQPYHNCRRIHKLETYENISTKE